MKIIKKIEEYIIDFVWNHPTKTIFILGFIVGFILGVLI